MMPQPEIDRWALDFARQVCPDDERTPQATTAQPAIISTEADLEAYVWRTFGVRVPKVRVCQNHCSPWDAFCYGYFAPGDPEEPRVGVIKGSRGLAGKSWLLALLGTTIATTLRGDVTILGGSGQQSDRVHAAMSKFWAAPNAPRELLADEPTITKTKFKAGQTIEALTASQRSARGPHPLALLLDEVDEMDLKLFNASMGQTMDQHGYVGRTIIGSTHQYPDKTMSVVLERAREKKWRVFEWCWKETLEPHGWLTRAQAMRKRGEMTKQMWDIEVELQEPSPEGRAIDPTKVERMFLRPEVESPVGDGEFPYREFEPPVDGATYATGGDWARARDYVEIATFRDDVWPLRLVAYQRFRKRAAPYIIGAWERQVGRYPGNGMHDSTSLGGKIMGDFIESDTTEGFDFGRHRLRQQLFTDYIIAVESEEVVAPRVTVLYGQHKYVRNDDLRPGGTGHPPDGFVACALAYRASAYGSTNRPLRLLTSQPVAERPANGNGHGLGKGLAFLGGNGGNDGNGQNGGHA